MKNVTSCKLICETIFFHVIFTSWELAVYWKKKTLLTENGCTLRDCELLEIILSM